MDRNAWKQNASCLDYEVDLFFDKYEENEQLRPAIEKLCESCPIRRECFANGISNKEYGVWGGVYLEKGKISREFGRHRDKKAWAQVWKKLTMDVK